LIIAVSDVHLGYSRSNRDQFKQFLAEVGGTLGKSDSFVLLGDIFDFWRRKNVAIVLENEDVLEEIENISADLSFVPGNHDFTFAAPGLAGEPFIKVQKSLTLRDDGVKFSFIHGYQLEVLANLEPLAIEEYEQLCISLCQRTGDFFGDLLSILWDTLQLSFKRGDRRRDMIQAIDQIPEKRRGMHVVDQLARSRARHLFLGVGAEDRLVFGHTHRPFIDERVANTGCWVSDSPVQNTYVEIQGGAMQLKHFDAE